MRVTFTIRRSAAMRKVRYMATLVYAKYLLDIVVRLVAAVYGVTKSELCPFPSFMLVERVGVWSPA